MIVSKKLLLKNLKSFKFIKLIKFVFREFSFIFLHKTLDHNNFLRIQSAINVWRQVLDRKNKLDSESSLKVLFVTGYGLGSHYLAIEPIIWTALKLRGAKVCSIFCNKAVPCCEFNSNGNMTPPIELEYRQGIRKSTCLHTCNICVGNLKSIYNELNIEKHGLNEYLTELDYINAWQTAKDVPTESFRDYIYDDIKVGEEAFSSILRVTFKGEIAGDTDLIKRYLYSGILTAIGYQKAFLAIKPDRVVCIHGIYQTHGLAVKICNKLKINVIVIGGGGIRKNTVILCHNETYHHQLINENNSLWINNELSEIEKKLVIDYAANKKSNGAGVDYLNYHPNPINSIDYLYTTYGLGNNRKLVTLYTNVIWDAQVVYKSNVFKDIFDWIFYTINLLGNNEEYYLIIRVHPAEAKGGLIPKQLMVDEINKMFPKLPGNVIIIEPESDLSSYTLAEHSDLNIIYGTKMGLEMALMKRPLLICGESFSRNKGYGIDIVNKDQYSQIIKNINYIDFDLSARYELALKYAYYLYFQRMIDMPFDMDGHNVLLKIKDKNELGVNNEAMEIICNGILKLEPFICKKPLTRH
jgi:hypothetical protein